MTSKVRDVPVFNKVNLSAIRQCDSRPGLTEVTEDYSVIVDVAFH